jgi:hypothetical protein
MAACQGFVFIPSGTSEAEVHGMHVAEMLSVATYAKRLGWRAVEAFLFALAGRSDDGTRNRRASLNRMARIGIRYRGGRPSFKQYLALTKWSRWSPASREQNPDLVTMRISWTQLMPITIR